MIDRSDQPIPSPERIATVLTVSPLPDDRIRLREILSRENWELQEASDCRGALALLREQRVPVLLCERDNPDGGWEDLLKATAKLSAPPNLIVFSRLADASFWAEVLNLGGFDVLMTPFDPEEVLRVTYAAWSRWECDFVVSTDGETEAADAAIESTRKCCHSVGSRGRDLKVSGLAPSSHDA